MIVSLALDVLIATLLVATIFYCFILNRKLEAMRSAQDEMRRLAEDFGRATAQARAGIAELKFAGEEAGQKLQAGIEKARSLADELAFVSEAGGRLAERLEQGIDSRRNVAPRPTARPTAAATPPEPAAAAAPRPARRPAARAEAARPEIDRELLQALRRAK